MVRTAKPPVIAGYTHVQLIGQGGFSDVFLYQQARPARPVAIKVLLEEQVDGPAVAQFEAEANVMAQLSSHPSIVSIYQADVTADGRPYLVMEYCPKPNLAARCRVAPLPVPEALEIAVRISGAVETAHRAGVLHRDIKPHNILVDAYDQPKLTDFGIASGVESDTEAGGMSVPWSPPEMFGDEPPRDPRSDVWSLAATLYHLLAGRSPFEVSDGNNDNHTLMTRIERQPVSPLHRADVDARLTEALARAMSKTMSNRYPSAMAFARALQDVQIGMHITPTRIDVLESAAAPVSRDVDDARTSIKPILVIPQSVPASASVGLVADVPAAEPIADTGFVTGRSRVSEDTDVKAPVAARPVLAEVAVPTQAPAPAPVPDRAPAPQPAPDREAPFNAQAVVLALVVVAALVGVGWWVMRDDPPGEGRPGALASEPPADAVGDPVPAPPIMREAEVKDGVITFRWTNPDGLDTDRFLWRLQGSNAAPEVVETKSVAVAAEPDGVTCIEVAVEREAVTSLPATTCEEALP